MEHHNIKNMFVTLQTADRHPSKPHPSMVQQALADAAVEARQAVVIGDTIYDIQMGRAAGTRTIGVNWGYHSVDDLRAAGAGAIAETMDELSTLLGSFA
jgi:phosphoglycolate phosphatase